MPIASRYRSRSTEIVGETTDDRYQRVWEVETGSVIINRLRHFPTEQWYYSPDQTCIDTVGFRTSDNPLYLVNEQSKPPVIQYFAEHTHDVTVGGVPNGYRQLDSRNYVGWGNSGHALALDEQDESDVEFVTRAVANVNPSRSNFQATVFLAELRDLPSLFKDLGTELAEAGFIRGSGGIYLKGQYGYKPLINDLKTFFNVADKIRNRMKTLSELRGSGKIRRQYRPIPAERTQIKIASGRLGYEHYVGVHPYDTNIIYCDSFTTMRTTRWCDIEFVLDTPDNLFSPIDNERWDEAHSLVYGTTVDGPSLWAAMPWSWLIDWTTNMSDYIRSQNNVVGAKFSKAVLMKTTHRESTVYPVWNENPEFNGTFYFTFSPGRRVTVVKERILNLEPAAVNTTEPILDDWFRTSILTGLTAQRFRPGRRINF